MTRLVSGVLCALPPGPGVFDLSQDLSHLLPGEAERTKGQSNVISSPVELQAPPEPPLPCYFYWG